MRDFRLNITISEYGGDPGNGEIFMAAFDRTHPEVGPVVSQNLRTGELTITFSLDAEDANDAFERGRPIFTEGAEATGLDPSEVIDVHVERVVPNAEYVDEPELVTA